MDLGLVRVLNLLALLQVAQVASWGWDIGHIYVLTGVHWRVKIALNYFIIHNALCLVGFESVLCLDVVLLLKKFVACNQGAVVLVRPSHLILSRGPGKLSQIDIIDHVLRLRRF